MVTIIGLLDTFADKTQYEAHERESEVIICDNMIIENYETLSRRLSIDIEIADSTKDEWHRMKAVWDTGAMTSVISKEKAGKMKLQPVDTGVGVGSTGTEEIPFYFANVRLSSDIIIPNVRICGASLKNHDVDFLIGMDIISKGDFRVRNESGKTRVTFEYDS